MCVNAFFLQNNSDFFLRMLIYMKPNFPALSTNILAISVMKKYVLHIYLEVEGNV